MDATPVEIRILGCLIEKQRTTPDQYPLTLNSLRLACNQSTNRDPVVDYDDATLREALERLGRKRWTRLTTGHGSRTAKYRQMLDEALGLGRDEIALLGVLMLRGAQTPGELKARVERLYPFDDLAALHETLDRLTERELVRRLDRQPGQKEERYVQLVGGEEAEAAPGGAVPSASPAALSETEPPVTGDLRERVVRLEEEVRSLRARLDELA